MKQLNVFLLNTISQDMKLLLIPTIKKSWESQGDNSFDPTREVLKQYTAALIQNVF